MNNMKALISVLVFGGVSTIVVAQAGTPGWNHGRNNCGPVGTPGSKTLTGCNACCTAAGGLGGPLTPGQMNDCLAYCAAVYANPNPWINPGGPNPW
jgi:hypothetical protein